MTEHKVTQYTVDGFASDLIQKVKETNKTYRIQVVEWRERRNLSQNALYWKWLGEISQQHPLKIEGSDLKSSYLWHEVFKKFYCPEKKIVSDDKSMPVKSTTLLDTGEMFFYLSCIEQWCIERGIMITIPNESEYQQLLKKQTE